MGSHKSISCTSPEVLPPGPEPVYHVSGILSPDSTCNYYYIGVYNDHPYYRRGDGSFFLFFILSASLWLLGPVLGGLSVGWFRFDPNIVGNYIPFGSYTGIATVSAGGH